MHYLDNASTTKPCSQAVEAASHAMTTGFGNPSSLHRLGRESESAVEAARSQVALCVNASPGEIFFTSGGTEADNWALFSGASLMRHKGSHIITTMVEHDAVLNSCRALENRGFEVTYLPPDSNGTVSADRVAKALRPETVLVSVMLVNNETGAVMPVSEISRAIKASGSSALLHTDAVQALLKIPVDVRSLGADLLSLSSHKVHGVKGCGALYIKKGLRLPPFIYGGGQESGLRSGTQAVPQITAFGAACSAGAKSFAEDAVRIHALKAMAESALKRDIPECTVISGDAPHILTVSIPGCPSQPVISLLAEKDVFVSAGSACSRGKRSHVLSAMGLRPELIDCAVRVSFSRFSCEEDVIALCSALKEAHSRFARSSGRRAPRG
ncbi:MAG: cysteine desulfurase [Oscillospiraceae bacterium]|nr:cysteine desulfurase [Oscillospiraceae bacterium]